jgi:hypothetical protein
LFTENNMKPSEMVCFTKKKLLILFNLSTGHSPRRFLACSGAFWQTAVWLSYVFQQWGPPGSPTI